MKKDNIFIKMRNSSLNIQDIYNYGKDGVGKAVIYALVLCSFIGLIKGIVTGISINSLFNNVINELNKEDYEFEIKNGIFDINESPIEIKEGNLLFYVDDTLVLDDIDNIKSKTVNSDGNILILKDGAYISESGMNSIIKYSELFNNITVGNSTLIEIIKGTKIVSIVIFAFINIITTFINYLLDAVVIGLFALTFAVMFGERILYKEGFSMAIYAGTLPNILVLILSIISPSTNFSIVALVATMLYTFIVQKQSLSKDNE